MDQATLDGLRALADAGDSLRNRRRLDWPLNVEHAVHALRLRAEHEWPALVGVYGGASSGKSTVFNNLLDGHLVSSVTARGHATLGPVLAAHESHRETLEKLLERGLLFPGFAPEWIELDDAIAGSADQLCVVCHVIEPLRHVILVDLPDFTSEAARVEGDVSLSLLPWFDRIVVVVDHERWFDRQSHAVLRADSQRYGQARWVIFNRTREEPLATADRERLAKQADRWKADHHTILEFRRGRGFCRFAPGTLDEVQSFLGPNGENRIPKLLSFAAHQASHVLNQNDERLARLVELRASLRAAVDGVAPSPADCMVAVMTPDERRHLDILARVFRTQETARWLESSLRRIRTAMRRVPILGGLVKRPEPTYAGRTEGTPSRVDMARQFVRSVQAKQQQAVQHVVQGSRFWAELRRWCHVEPTETPPPATPMLDDTVDALDDAIRQWSGKLEEECRGISPHFKGAIGVSALAIAAVLVAVPGPIAALTLASAKGALGAVAGPMLAWAGVGAAAGRQLGRLSNLIQERWIGSREFRRTKQATEDFRNHVLLRFGDALAAAAVEQAEEYTIRRAEIRNALACVGSVEEVDP